MPAEPSESGDRPAPHTPAGPPALPRTRLRVLAVFLSFGLLLGVFRVASGDIWAGIGFHVAYQAAAQLFVGEGAVFEVSGEGVFGVLALGGPPFLAAWAYLAGRHRAALDGSATAP
ncbi:hypothetical protein [Streptomyces sp. CNQ-509]|uniref:hypothetical protein n=1 Tax=Streptomyces sp. CNQ-509 TaxID=444103 RepID=UPI000AE31277|nr:hypothetical protein [Streptomyces sp. CNQ-509]